MVQDTADLPKQGVKSPTSAAQASTANTQAEQQHQQQQRDQKQPQEQEQGYGSSKPQNGATSGGNQQPKPAGRQGRPYVGPHILLPPPKPDSGDGKIVLLFDLNGVLTEKTPPRVEGKFVKRDHIVRPHIEELLRLHPHFRIGVFSSATVRTVNTALDTLYAALQRSAALRGIDGVLLPKKYDLFNVICYRDHCKPDPYWQTRADGKDHDTIKPLARLGFDLQRTVLVDNDDYKAADGEHENMLHVPHWEQTNVTNRDFPLMVQLILRHLSGVEGDVRPHLRIIERELRQLRQLEDPRFKTATDRAKGRAVTAATAQSWAGDDSIRQELAAEVIAAAAAAADGPVDAEQQLQYTPQMQQKMRQLALSGIKAFTAAALSETPKPAQQLIQLLSNHKAASQAAAAAAEQASDGHKLLADDGEADAAATYSQHAMVLLLSAVWACHLTVPAGAFTLSQLTDALAAKGWPTAHAAAAVEAMINAGTIKVWSSSSSPDQQQQQQQQWAWPAAPGTWPAAAASTPPAAVPSTAQPLQQLQQRQQPPQQQQPPAWADCLLLLPDPRVKQLMKAVDDITPYLEAAAPAAAVELAMTLEYSCQLLNEPNKDAQKSIQAKRLQLLNNTPTMDERNKIIGLSGSWATMISAAARDLSTAHGVTIQQLLRFVKGLNPELQQQLLGPSSSSDEEQQQRLQGLLIQLQEVVKAVPVCIKDKRQKSLLGPPFGVFAAMPLPVFRQQRGGNVAQQQHADPAAAARLTRYAVGIVPNAEAVGRSIQLLLAGAKATTAAAVQEALSDAQKQQQQQLQQHQAHLQQQPQHGLLLQLKPPVTACLTVSTTLNLPAVVVQWLLQGEQIRQQQEQQQQGNSSGGGAVQRKDSKRAREGSAGADAATPAAGAAASSDAVAAAAAAAPAAAAVEGDAAAAEATGDETPGKRQKRDPRQQQQQQEQSVRDDADALHLDALHSPRQAAAAAAAADSGKAAAAAPAAAAPAAAAPAAPAAASAEEHISVGATPAPAAAAADSIQQDADMAKAAAGEHQDGEDDLDALYEAEEQRKQLEEQQEAAAAAELTALQAEEDAAAAAELAALDAGPGDNTAEMASAGFEAGSSRGADGMDADMADADGVEGGQELGFGDDDEGDVEVDEDEWEDNQGCDGDDNDDDAGDDDDDMGPGGAAAADGSGSGGGSEEEEYEDGDAGPDGTGSFDGGTGSDAPTAGAADGEGEDDSEADPEDECEFQGEYGSEDGSDAWATDDEADGQLQLGITGLDGNDDDEEDDDGVEAADAVAAAAEDKAAQEAAAAMQKASAAAAAAAGQSVRGSTPLYSKLSAALAKARKLDSSSNGSSAQPVQQQKPSRLHAELLQFASAAAPCAVERLFVETALQQLQDVAEQLWHQDNPEAVLFGSQATGLALPGSDLDVVLLRVPGCPQTRLEDKGYTAEKRKRVVQLLQAFANKLRAEGYATKKGVQIVSAKVPILKANLQVFVSPGQLLAALGQDSKAAAQQLRTALGGNSLNSKPDKKLRVDMEVDVSLGIADSAAAVNFLQRQVRTLPPLRPLLLGAKAVLREAGLNEVFTGGLGSYSLALLVLSHLQAEGVANPASSGMQPLDLKSPSNMAGVKQHLQHIAAAAAGAAAAGGRSGGRQQGVEWDLGLLLQGFFLRFGALFDYTAEAVSVNQGGILPKPQQWVQSKRPFLLAVEDPAMPGRDMSSGSYAIRDVKATFTRAAGVLRVLTSELEDPTGSTQHTASAALAARAAAGMSVEKVAAAVAAAAAASGAAQPGSSQKQKQQPQQPQQQRSLQFSFEVVEDRQGWAAVQADGQSRSVTPPEVAAAAAGGGGGSCSSRSSSLAGSHTGVAAAAAAAGQQLTAGLKESFGMLGQLVDIVAALGRGAAAEAHRSEKARHAALRGQARLVAQKRQYQLQQQQQQEEDKEEQRQQQRQRQQDMEVIATEQQLAAYTPNVNPKHPLLVLHSRVLAALACLDPEDAPVQKHKAGPKLGLSIRQLLQQEVQLKQHIDALIGPGKTLQLRQKRSWCKNQSREIKRQLQLCEQSLKQTLRLAGDALSRMGVSMEALAPSAELLAAAAGVGAVMRPGMFTAFEAAVAAAGGARSAGKKKKQKQKQPQPQKQKKVRLGGQQGQQQRQKGRQGQQGGQQQAQGQPPSKAKMRAQRRKKQQQQQPQQAGKKRRRDGGAGNGGGGRGWGYDD